MGRRDPAGPNERIRSGVVGCTLSLGALVLDPTNAAQARSNEWPQPASDSIDAYRSASAPQSFHVEPTLVAGGGYATPRFIRGAGGGCCTDATGRLIFR